MNSGLSNGRDNEYWQSMFDDQRQAHKLLRNPYQFAEIHPIDAKNREMTSGDLVLVYSNRVAIAKDSFLGVKNEDYSFTSMKENGHIQFKKGLFFGCRHCNGLHKGRNGFFKFPQ